MFSISIFFLLGIYVLWRVDERAGARVALAEEAALEAARVAD